MATKQRVTLAIVSAFFAVICLTGAPQHTAPTLSENDLIKLLNEGASSSAIIDLVQKYGVSFQPDESSIQRLTQAGATADVLEAVRRAVRPPAAKPAETPARDDSAKALAAGRHLKLGQLKAQDKDYDGALREFAEAEKIKPDLGDVFYQRGLVLADLCRYTEAAVEWKKYLDMAEAGADTKAINDKIVEWQYKAEKNAKLRDLAERGDKQLKSFDADGAIATFQDASKIQPSQENLSRLAKAYWVKGDYDSLSKVAGQALALDQNSPQGLLYKGAAELGQGATDQAVATIQRALVVDPKSGFGHELLCDAYRIKRDLRNAQLQCQEALQVNPDSAFAHDRMGWILWDRREYLAALGELRRAAESEPKNAEWQADVAYALVRLHDVSGAVAAGRQAITLNAKSASAHDAYGMALEAQGKLAEAIKEYNEAVRLGPVGQAQFIDHLSHAMRKRGSTR